jgi:O-antigen/teichoic acid export membrane protein/glycosyltransferase involved in cell wall biosynthesis
MNLATTQLLSLATKAITTALGIVQALLVVLFLSKPEFGVVGLVTAIGSVIGVTQHLGVVDGAIREIAVIKKRAEIGKLFWVSHVMRQAVTLPLSVGLIILASFIAERVYNLPEIAALIRLYAASLVLLGIQDVLGATLTGMKKFVSLYVVQIGTAVLNILIFAYFTWRFSIAGYFWAIIVTTAVMVVWYSLIIARSLKGHLALPAWADIAMLSRRIFRISIYMYAARILFVVWQRLPLLVLGIVIAKDQLGDLTLALTFGSKLTILAMALSEVNLSWMSSLFVQNQREFQQVVTRNMQRLLFVLVSVTAVLIFFAPEILHIPILLEYLPARNLVIVMTVAFFMYALTDVGTSSVFVAADQPRWRAILYALMTGITGLVMAWLMLDNPDPFLATLGVLAGATVAYAAMVIIAWRRFQVALLTWSLLTILVLLMGSMWWLLGAPPLVARILVFMAFVAWLGFEARRGQLIPTFRRHSERFQFICFAGAFYDAPTWTNRQHIMSRFSKAYPVFYVEPRVWIVRYLLDNWREPAKIAKFLQRVVWWEEVTPKLYIKAQWNLIPGSREYGWIGWCNHLFNRWNVLLSAKLLGFANQKLIVWLYDTEAAEYLSAFPASRVVYDCVDDHSVQAGPDRNPERVRAEERQILTRANLVTVTSQHLYEQKKPFNANTHLVEQGGDVTAFLSLAKKAPAGVTPTVGSVGALDSYKYDFDLIEEVARTHPEWRFVFVGEPVVNEARITPLRSSSFAGQGNKTLRDVANLSNVTLVGAVPRQHVPEHVQNFDVCIIPYRASEYNRSSFPLKFWECMASGLPELQKYRDCIGYAATPAQFGSEIAAALREGERHAARRRELAHEHSWEKRVEELLRLLQNVRHHASI